MPVEPWSSKEAVSAGVSGGHVRHLGRLDALQEHPLLRRRGEPVGGGGGEDVAAAVAIAEWRRRASVLLLLLLPAELLLERRGVLAPVQLVVEGHDGGRGRREAVYLFYPLFHAKKTGPYWALSLMLQKRYGYHNMQGSSIQSQKGGKSSRLS